MKTLGCTEARSRFGSWIVWNWNWNEPRVGCTVGMISEDSSKFVSGLIHRSTRDNRTFRFPAVLPNGTKDQNCKFEGNEMSLETLSNEISMQAEAEAKSIIDDAKAEARIRKMP